MELRTAQISDIDAVLKLHKKYQKDSIKKKDIKDGFVTTAFTIDQLTRLIEQEQGLFIAKEKSKDRNQDKVVAYVMAASWGFWSEWPMFAYMIEQLPDANYDGVVLNQTNSYQYGPVCIDTSERGTGLLEKIFEFSLNIMSRRYQILVTFINKINSRSYIAHTKKLGLIELSEFEFNKNNYYWLVCSTKR